MGPPTDEQREDPMQTYEKLYIDGAWVDPAGSGTIDVISASTEEVMGRIPEGTPADVDRAVAAARVAFPAWSQTAKEERGKLLQRLSEGLGSRMVDIATTIAGEVGMPMRLSQMIQAGLPTAVMSSYPQILEEFPFEEHVNNSLVVRSEEHTSELQS